MAESRPLSMRAPIVQGWVVEAKGWQVKTKQALSGFVCVAEIIEARIRTWAGPSLLVPH